MKTTLPLHRLLRTFFLCVFCCASLSVLAQGDDDKNTDPDSDPPARTSAASAAAVFSTSASLEVIFLEKANDVQVEVYNAEGVTVSVAVGTVDANSRLQLDSRSWKRGTYTLRLKVKGKPVSSSSVRLQ